MHIQYYIYIDLLSTAPPPPRIVVNLRIFYPPSIMVVSYMFQPFYAPLCGSLEPTLCPANFAIFLQICTGFSDHARAQKTGLRASCAPPLSSFLVTGNLAPWTIGFLSNLTISQKQNVLTIFYLPILRELYISK